MNHFTALYRLLSALLKLNISTFHRSRTCLYLEEDTYITINIGHYKNIFFMWLVILSISWFECALIVGASSNSIVVSMFDSTVSPGLEIDLEFSLGNVGANNFELNISS